MGGSKGQEERSGDCLSRTFFRAHFARPITNNPSTRRFATRPLKFYLCVGADTYRDLVGGKWRRGEDIAR